MSDRLLRLAAVIDRVGLEKTAIYDRISSGTFPAPAKLGTNTARWFESEVDEWMQTLKAARDGDQNGDERRAA